MPKTIEPFLPPPKIAKFLRVSPDKVLGRIRRTELKSVNVGSGTKRAIYQLSHKSLDEFLRFHGVQPVAPIRRRMLVEKQLDGGPIDPVLGKKLAEQGLDGMTLYV